jgi:hypothetical protein
VEQGTHSELVAKGGVFAAMWADQVSHEDSASSASSIQIVKDAVLGYAVDDGEPAAVETQESTTEPLVETLEAQPAEVPAAATDTAVVDVPVEAEAAPDAPVPEEVPKVAELPASPPVAFPRSEPSEDAAALATSPQESVAFPVSPELSAPVAFAFPGSETSLTNSPALSGAGTPGVTFQNIPSPSTGGRTPDVDQDGKRRRTLSTQGMQRLARRLSVSGRRENSSTSIPTAILNTFKRENSKRDVKETLAKDGSKDNLPITVRDDGSLAHAAEGSSARDSPSASVMSNIDQAKLSKKQKKEKGKEKKRKNTAPM